MLLQVLADGIIAGCAYALVAFGFALIYNTTRTFHFTHGAVYTFSVYLFYTLSVPPGRPRWLAVALALALTALLGVAVDEIVYRPLVRRNSSPLIQLLSSLGTYIIIVNLVLMAYGNEVKVLSAGLQRTYSYGGGVLSEVQIATAAWCAVIFAGLVLLLRLTRLGKLIRAMRDDPDLVAALGVAPQTVRRAVFALGSALAGAAEKSLRGGAEPI